MSTNRLVSIRRRQFVVLAGTGISCTVAGCSSLLTTEPSRTAEATVIESTFGEVPEANAYYMTGQVKNTGEVRLGNPVAIARFYNKDGSVLHSTEGSVYSLKPRQIWGVPLLGYAVGARSEPPVKGPLEPSNFEAGYVNYTHPPEVTVANVQLEAGAEPAIVGDITNTTDKTISLFADVQFLSNQKHVIDSSSEGFSALGPGKTWVFTVPWSGYRPTYDSHPTGYELYLRIFYLKIINNVWRSADW